MTYLKNCWYLAAWADEVPPGSSLARTILDTPVVIFRSEEGIASAIFDRCPHRFVPLSKGRVKNDAIACIYHGLAFNGQGTCIFNPHGPILRNMKIPAYPLVEDFFGLWIWMGNSDLADKALMPRLDFVNATPKTAFSKGYLRGAGGYQLLVDNILDLTHVDYLHPETLGGGAITRLRASIDEQHDEVSVSWLGKNEMPPPVVAALMPAGELIDFSQVVKWTPPATLTLISTTVSAGKPLEEGTAFRNLHIMTPETATSSHYFFAATRDYALDDAELNERLAALRLQIFSTEDKPVIEAQQMRMGTEDFWDLKLILLKTDEGAIRVRRKLQALILAEEEFLAEPATSA